MSSPLLLNVLITVVLLVTTAHAAERDVPQSATSTSREAEHHALSPVQINAIRVVGRNVLAAKKIANGDSTDAEQIARLRASLDKLIEVELAPNNRGPITVQGQESAKERRSSVATSDMRQAARLDALTLAGQLRKHGALLASQAENVTETEGTSAGFPIRGQRAQLFERWAQKLNAALADDNPERLGQLRELRGQLNATKGGLSDVPLAHGTPTLQAMPAGFVPPENTNPAAKEQRNP